MTRSSDISLNTISFPPLLSHHRRCHRRFNLERDVAEARAQVAATAYAEKMLIERANAADKKVEEAKIVVSPAKQEAAALQAKIKGLTAELSVATGVERVRTRNALCGTCGALLQARDEEHARCAQKGSRVIC